MAEFDILFQRAESLEDQGELYAALECWRLLARLKADSGVWCRLAQAAMELGLVDEAESAFRSALKLDETVAPAYVGLATLRMEKVDLASAERLFHKALTYEKDATTYCLLGSAQLRSNKIEEARESFCKALTLDPGYEEAYYNLGVTYRGVSPKEGERFFKKALQLDGDFAAAHRELGFLRLRAGDLDSAEVHLRRARQLDPESMWGRIYLANLLWQRGYLIEAREEYVAAVLLAHGLGYPRFLFGNFLEAQGELDEATKLYSAALELEPDNAETLAKLAGVMCRKGDPAAAREFVARALKIEPTNKTALRILETLEAVRRPDELFPT